MFGFWAPPDVRTVRQANLLDTPRHRGPQAPGEASIFDRMTPWKFQIVGDSDHVSAVVAQAALRVYRCTAMTSKLPHTAATYESIGLARSRLSS